MGSGTEVAVERNRSVATTVEYISQAGEEIPEDRGRDEQKNTENMFPEIVERGVCLYQSHGTVGAASINPVANHWRMAAARIECRVRAVTGEKAGGLPDSPSMFVRVRRQRITDAAPPRIGAKATVCPVAPMSKLAVMSAGVGGHEPMFVTT